MTPLDELEVLIKKGKRFSSYLTTALGLKEDEIDGWIADCKTFYSNHIQLDLPFLQTKDIRKPSYVIDLGEIAAKKGGYFPIKYSQFDIIEMNMRLQLWKEFLESKPSKSHKSNTKIIKSESKQTPMKIDDKLIYLLLLKYEGEEEVDLSKYSSNDIYHAEAYLIREGYLVGEIWNTSNAIETKVTDMRGAGAILLEEIRTNKNTIIIEFPPVTYSYEDGKPIPFEADSKQKKIDEAKLTYKIRSLYSVDEINDLCMDLKVDRDIFPQDNINKISTELVKHFHRRRQMKKLFDAILKQRPDAKEELLACLE